jgi:predicted nuclease of predicted toxin-antitoxin system
MRLLIDECLPKKLKPMLAAAGHECETVREAGLGSLTNGELLARAEFRWDVLVTIDQNMRYQQNFVKREISILVLCAHSNDLTDIAPLVPAALAALKSLQPGEIVEVGNTH